MRLAIYSSDNIGHYGLSLLHYCHFTSPIRRYVDLVAHRILFHENEEKDKLEMIAARCSEQERISAKAENSVVLLKKLRLLSSRHAENSFREYEAVVTKVKNFGIYFEVLELMLESYLHVSDLENDYYLYDDAEAALRGRRTGITYRAGDKMFVRLREVDLITMESRWELFGSEHREPVSVPSKGKKRRGPPSGKKASHQKGVKKPRAKKAMKGKTHKRKG